MKFEFVIMSTVGALSAACAPEILKALNALSSQTNEFQAPKEIGRIHLKKSLHSCWKWNLTICLRPMTSVQSNMEDLMAGAASSIGTG